MLLLTHRIHHSTSWRLVRMTHLLHPILSNTHRFLSIQTKRWRMDLSQSLQHSDDGHCLHWTSREYPLHCHLTLSTRGLGGRRENGVRHPRHRLGRWIPKDLTTGGWCDDHHGVMMVWMIGKWVGGDSWTCSHSTSTVTWNGYGMKSQWTWYRIRR